MEGDMKEEEEEEEEATLDPLVWERSAARAPTRYMTASRVVALQG
jgi:hypothetical protein